MSIVIKILILFILLVAMVATSISIGWRLHILHELKQDEGGRITLDGDVSADSRYYYIRVFESDTLVEHLRVPRFNSEHTLDISAYQSPIKITIKNK